jgi:hypothetical protein
VTLALVLVAFAGYASFRTLLIHENKRRRFILDKWSVEDVEAENRFGRGPLPHPSSKTTTIARRLGGESLAKWVSELLKPEGRKGSERITIQYGL